MLYAGLGEPVTGNKKKIAPEMLKIQPDFREIRGKVGKNVDIAGHTWTRWD